MNLVERLRNGMELGDEAKAADRIEQLEAALRDAKEAIENGKRVRNYESGTQYQPALEDAALKTINAALGGE